MYEFAYAQLCMLFGDSVKNHALSEGEYSKK